MSEDSNNTPEHLPPSEPQEEAHQHNDADLDGLSDEEFREALKRGLDNNCLTPEVKAQILAELPPPEEMERMLRDLIEHGGLSSEEFLTSLGIPLPRR